MALDYVRIKDNEVLQYDDSWDADPLNWVGNGNSSSALYYNFLDTMDVDNNALVQAFIDANHGGDESLLPLHDAAGKPWENSGFAVNTEKFGTTAQRPTLNTTTDVPYFRFNTTETKLEIWNGTAWVDHAGVAV